MASEEAEEEEYVSEAGLPSAVQEFAAIYRDAETITGKFTCILKPIKLSN